MLRLVLAVFLLIAAQIGPVTAQPADFDAALDRIEARAFAEAVAILTPLAEAGDPAAQHELALLYLTGRGVQQDAQLAIYWLGQAAEQGFVMSQFGLGLRYMNGEGVEQDYAQALDWFILAAEQDLPEAAYHIGLFYANGWGVAQDYLLAIDWTNRAADGGFLAAHFNLGVAYVLGQGVDIDPVMSFFHFAVAYLLSGQDTTGPLFSTVNDIARQLTLEQRDQGIVAAEAWVAALAAGEAE